MKSKEEIKELVEDFNYTDPLTDEEFDGIMDILTQYLLFNTKWEDTVLKNPKIRRTIPIIDDIPLKCKVDDCLYAAKCPILKAMPKSPDRLALLDSECRADKLYAIQEFTAFVKELQIDPDQTTDILNVASLVRLLIIKRRIDWTLAIEGIMGKEPGVIDQRTGQVYWKNVIHPLLKVSESIEKQVAILQKQLMADRQARAALASSLGKGSDILKDLFSGQFKLLEQNNAIEAEFYDEPEEPEE